MHKPLEIWKLWPIDCAFSAFGSFKAPSKKVTLIQTTEHWHFHFRTHSMRHFHTCSETHFGISLSRAHSAWVLLGNWVNSCHSSRETEPLFIIFSVASKNANTWLSPETTPRTLVKPLQTLEGIGRGEIWVINPYYICRVNCKMQGPLEQTAAEWSRILV